MNTTLNLSRKWRSKQFDEIVGQDLSVRILKNSLYKNTLFPVYLFAGQHGCGKTTSARVFAAAINCSSLKGFRESPKDTLLPCLACESCKAMMQGRHPDFIEIDAASSTGVDNVRHIIDSSSLLPVMGSKKIYLIDEAHMLSKAAFNAFLKILEEPPSSVLFILATTDADKILETVKSRCFQLSFDPINTKILVNHLAFVAKKETIPYESNALALIAKESSGSARDALNLLEQVRFASPRVTVSAVQELLGHLDDTTMLELFALMLKGNAAELITFFEKNKIQRRSAQFIWKTLVTLLRASLWLKHGVSSDEFSMHHDQIKKIITECSWQDINDMLDHFYAHELLFKKTSSESALLEMIILQIIQKRNGNNNSGSTPASLISSEPIISEEEDELDQDEEEDEQEDDEQDESLEYIWSTIIRSIKQLNDPLLDSIFLQGAPKAYDPEKKALIITFAQEHQFFKGLLNQMKHLWEPVIKKVVRSDTPNISFEFVTSAKSVEPVIKKDLFRPAERKKQQLPKRNYTGAFDVSDRQKWPKTNLVLDYFPGTVREIARK